MDPNYKARKEAFVSNLSGSSIQDINTVSLVASTSVLLWSALQSRLSFFTPYGPAALLTDFILNVLAILFATTAYSSSPLLLNILLATPAVLLFLTQPPRSRSPPKARPPSKQPANNGGSQDSAESLPIHPFLTTYRAAMMVITCLAILAVDFRVFPRRFAKVENWGTSLMDLGVGSFVFSAGVVSARAVLKRRTSNAAPTTLLSRLLGSVRHSIPLLVLGLIRLWSVKGLDYAEHVTEYGVHWNFFFTLGLLPPFVEVFDSLTVLIPSYEVLALVIVVLYQVVLESTDLKEYILISPRGPDLLSKNREGIFSFLGYLAIFLAGRGVGTRIIPRRISSSKSPQQARKSLLVGLVCQVAFWSTLFYFNSTYAMGYGANILVSRRLANMPYVLWVSAFNSAQLLLFCFVETVFFPTVHRATGKEGENERTSLATSHILHAFNRGGLAIFLIANLLTGAVNLSVPTLDVNALQAMIIMVAYAAILTVVALGLDKFNIKLRL
ncbi:GPI-anchored wall transfer protein 1 [Penicillium hispanicum]|uniref:GPI-anchored wall transfer protein 1 n=1 Tax=Penicillium hispanicum TaxID=1080232 RepID=UPI00254170FD|nr:GPI-anchored wall transfer protein 1 [Penicillium hispanicum]KAJ5578538.1 GPI-anchored wall transfer protein 1 [Penicillium hispanicum]